jgi:hypothetical protein
LFNVMMRDFPSLPGVSTADYYRWHNFLHQQSRHEHSH